MDGLAPYWVCGVCPTKTRGKSKGGTCIQGICLDWSTTDVRLVVDLLFGLPILHMVTGCLFRVGIGFVIRELIRFFSILRIFPGFRVTWLPM